MGPQEEDPIHIHLALISKVSVQLCHTNKAGLKLASSGMRGRDEDWLLHKTSSFKRHIQGFLHARMVLNKDLGVG